MKHCYTAIILNHETLFIERQYNQWRLCEIDGAATHHTQSAVAFGLLLEKLNQRINLSKKLADVELHILYGENQQAILANITQQLTALNCTHWQILQWQPLFARASVLQKPNKSPLQEVKWLEKVALPMFAQILDYRDEAWEAEQQRARLAVEESIESLKAERAGFEAQISALRGQIQAMQRPNMEQLTTFLPIIYRNFWNLVKPSDLALLASTYDVPQVPSPFPEPDDYTVSLMKKRLLALPVEDRRRLLDFCQQLSLNQHIRPAMKSVFEEA